MHKRSILFPPPFRSQSKARCHGCGCQSSTAAPPHRIDSRSNRSKQMQRPAGDLLARFLPASSVTVLLARLQLLLLQLCQCLRAGTVTERRALLNFNVATMVVLRGILASWTPLGVTSDASTGAVQQLSFHGLHALATSICNLILYQVALAGEILLKWICLLILCYNCFGDGTLPALPTGCDGGLAWEIEPHRAHRPRAHRRRLRKGSLGIVLLSCAQWWGPATVPWGPAGRRAVHAQLLRALSRDNMATRASSDRDARILCPCFFCCLDVSSQQPLVLVLICSARRPFSWCCSDRSTFSWDPGLSSSFNLRRYKYIFRLPVCFSFDGSTGPSLIDALRGPSSGPVFVNTIVVAAAFAFC